MKRSQLLVLLCTSALAFTGATAEAQRGGDRDRGNGAERVMMMLRASDANGDNTITLEEIEGLQAEMFAWMDRNGDGYLDVEDQNPMRQRLMAQRQAELGDEEARGPRRGRGGRGRHGPGGEHRRADSNGDGRVSQAEFMAVEHPLFERLDTNSDGAITPDELDAAVERRQSRRMWWRD